MCIHFIFNVNMFLHKTKTVIMQGISRFICLKLLHFLTFNPTKVNKAITETQHYPFASPPMLQP